MTDKIVDIRERHKASDNNFIEYESTWDIHADRATLLAEVDRQRAENERLRAEMLDLAEWCETEEPLSYKKLTYRLRAALEAKP